jgi:predicted Zn-dependent protease
LALAGGGSAQPPRRGAAPPPAGPPLIEILASELARNFDILKEKADPAPYFASYFVVDETSEALVATRGGLQSAEQTRRRAVDVMVRVGSREFDNYHVVDGDRPLAAASAPLPVEDKPEAVRQVLWRETDRAWRAAAQRYIKVRAASQVRRDPEKPVPDFSTEEPATRVQEVPALPPAGPEWAARLRSLSLQLSGGSGIISSAISLSTSREVKTYVSTEGARLQYGRTFVRLSITARAKAPDGEDLAASESFDATDLKGLPGEKVLSEAVRKVTETLRALAFSQPADPYTGPAILSGRAAGVFFHEIFGHRVEGHRQKDTSEGQTFSNSVGKPVLPEFLSVDFDPTARSAAGVSLNGWYDFDDEGIPAMRVPLVEAGILKTFLLSRSPLPGFPKSNGHGRKRTGYEPVSRQSNLIVRSEKKVSEAQLRQMLIEEARRQGKPYGLYFQEVTGGYTTTRRQGLQAFTVIPLVVSRVWADGRPDELIRGADIVGTPLTSFSKILATSDREAVFNGFCGAESGSVPVSAVSPALLVGEIEIQRKPAGGDRPPLLPRPAVEEGSPQ